jgi:hypothetical protein
MTVASDTMHGTASKAKTQRFDDKDAIVTRLHCSNPVGNNVQRVNYSDITSEDDCTTRNTTK